MKTDETLDPGLRSWVESANLPGTDFPIQNLPLGLFRTRGSSERPRIGVAIGDSILNLAAVQSSGLLRGLRPTLESFCSVPILNPLMSLGRESARELRRRLSEILSSGARGAARDASLLVPMDRAELLVPARIGDYTDFYASIHHAERVGRMLRPNNPLLPNYKHVPIAYHGRSSTIVTSGTPVPRPLGQIKPPDQDQPVFGPTRLLDAELELGFRVGAGNLPGHPIPIDEAEDRIFGFSLVNDWSARDIQAWEYQPLGPFLSKNFATSVSPWVVTLDALAPFRAPAFPRPAGDPEPLPYLSSPENSERGAIDMSLELHLSSERMRELGLEPVVLARCNSRDLYWTPAQMLTHHASNGCSLQPGDLIASGTVSGPDAGSMGCLLEITRRGADPIDLPSGEKRAFLEDGDEVILRGFCEREGYVRIGLGECRGVVLPAPYSGGSSP